jgi:hypothetical protein
VINLVTLDFLGFSEKVKQKYPSTFAYYSSLGSAGVSGWNSFVTWAAQNYKSIWPSESAGWSRNFLDALAGIGGVVLAPVTGGLSLALTGGALADVTLIRPAQQTVSTVITGVQAGAYQAGSYIAGTIDTTINTGKKALADVEAGGKTIIDAGGKLLTDAEKAGKTIADAVGGLSGSAKGLMDSFSNALKNLKLPESLANITLPSINLPSIGDITGGATTGGISMTTLAILGGIGALGAILILR